MMRFALSLVGLILPAIAWAAEPKLPDLAIESYRLPNGLKVVLHRDPAVPRVTVVMAYHVGSKNERAGRTGFAHFFEHMMFRGTKNVPNYDIPLQETGAQSNAYTNEDATVYFETVPAEYLERALYLEAERLAFLPSALEQTKFDTEREVVKNERRQSVENVPYGLADETILATLYPKGHPYSWSVLGSMKDLDRSNLDDLRRFFAEYYQPSNATLVLAGDFDPAVAKGLVEKYFGPLASGPEPAKLPKILVQAKSSRVRLADQVTLPRIYLVWPTVDDDHPDTPALDLLAHVLAGGETSRLHQALVRNLKIAKGVGAQHPTHEIGGEFRVSAIVLDGKSIESLEAALLKELERFRANPPTAAELSRELALKEIQGYQSLTSVRSRAFALATGSMLYNDPNRYKKELERAFAVTAADLARVSAKYLTPEKLTLTVEPAKPSEAKSTAPDAGPLASTAVVEALPNRQPKPGVDWSKLPGPNAAPAFQVPTYERRTLSNGVELWFSKWTTFPIVSIRLGFDFGTADDPPGKDGLATLSASCFSEGTKTKDAVRFAEEQEALGFSFWTMAATESSGVHCTVLSRNLVPALALLREQLTEPRFDPADFEREKRLQIDQVLAGPDSPEWILLHAFDPLIYGAEHPLGRSAGGRVENVKAITLEDVKQFAAKAYTTTNAKLIVVGDVELDALVKALEESIGTWKTKSEAKVSLPNPRPFGKPGVIYLIDKPGAAQSIICIGRRWLDRKHPSHDASTIGNHLFGGNFLSRLNKNLREKNGFSYGASSSFDYKKAGGEWQSGSSVRTDATAPALAEILKELDELGKTTPLTPEEIELSRSAIIRTFPEEFDSPTGIASAIGEIATFGLPADYFQTYVGRIRSTPAAEVASIMSRLADASERMILIVGDRKAIEPAIKALKRGEVRVITLEEAMTPR